jgi:hypothetical protein
LDCFIAAKRVRSNPSITPAAGSDVWAKAGRAETGLKARPAPLAPIAKARARAVNLGGWALGMGGVLIGSNDLCLSVIITKAQVIRSLG